MSAAARECDNSGGTEREYKLISAQIHSAWAEIDVAALRHNADVVRQLAPHAKIMAMLKADAYGHGALLCAQALLNRVDGMAVARLEEAEQLRLRYPQLKLLLTAASLDLDALRWCADRRIAVVVHEDSVLRSLLALASPPAVWLKLNTGMNRLGFSAQQFVDAFGRLRGRVSELVAMTHFACADEPRLPVTARQIEAFDRVLAQLPCCAQSLANSAAVLSFPAAHRDWVRPGLMLYGVNPGLEALQYDLRPVMRLKTRVLAVHDVPAGGGVGYGLDWHASQAAKVATVAIGYGDGYPRVWGAQGRALVRGQACPLVGRVSMDLLALDVSALESVAVGEEVMLWGDGLRVEDLAPAAGTIAYELLSQVQQRVPRLPMPV